MKLKLLLFLLFFFSLFFANTKRILAQSCDASIANFNEASRDLTVCIGGFSSPAELRSATAHINCIDSSNLLGTGCYDTEGYPYGQIDYPLSGTPNDKIAQDSNGKYYTCPIIQGIDRAVGKMNVNITGPSTCSTPEAVIRPGNWNMATEGNRIGQAITSALGITPPSNVAAGAAGCVASDGTQGINTALGCISFDATRGGFVRALLNILIGLGGGVALLLILYGVFIVTTSAGIPDKLNQGKEIISSAVAGLVFIILAIFLMNLIGIRILALPGLE